MIRLIILDILKYLSTINLTRANIKQLQLLSFIKIGSYLIF